MKNNPKKQGEDAQANNRSTQENTDQEDQCFETSDLGECGTEACCEMLCCCC